MAVNHSAKGVAAIADGILQGATRPESRLEKEQRKGKKGKKAKAVPAPAALRLAAMPPSVNLPTGPAILVERVVSWCDGARSAMGVLTRAYTELVGLQQADFASAEAFATRQQAWASLFVWSMGVVKSTFAELVPNAAQLHGEAVAVPYEVWVQILRRTDLSTRADEGVVLRMCVAWLERRLAQTDALARAAGSEQFLVEAKDLLGNVRYPFVPLRVYADVADAARTLGLEPFLREAKKRALHYLMSSDRVPVDVTTTPRIGYELPAMDDVLHELSGL